MILIFMYMYLTILTIYIHLLLSFFPNEFTFIFNILIQKKMIL